MSMWSRHGIFTHPAWTPPPLCSPALQRPEGWKLHLSDSLAWGCLFQTYCRSVSKLCPTLCNRMNCSTPGFPELRYLLEFAQTHVHWVNDAIQPFHPLSSPSPDFSLSQHQGLFQWVDSSYHMAKVSELQLQHQPFQRIFRFVSFRMDWIDLLAVQGTLKSLLQHHRSKVSIL